MFDRKIIRKRVIKKRVLQPGAIPLDKDGQQDWPNGSGFYRYGTITGPSWKKGYNENIGLLGRTIRLQSGIIKAWRHLGAGKYTYLGEFKTDYAARERILRRA